MKEKSSSQKTSQPSKPAAGQDGAAIAPPVYEMDALAGAALAIQRKPAPETGHHAPGGSSPNRTGLPDALKSGIESLSGLAMDDVRVHTNSPKPAQLQALAYAQGTDIHIAPGQERHLPHEAWHVVQQKQGRVAATLQTKGVGINDDTALEIEADQRGEAAARLGQRESARPMALVREQLTSTSQPIQRALVRDQEILDERGDTFNWGSFKGKRDNSDPTQVGTEKGRGAQLANVNFGGGAQSSVTWQAVDTNAGEGTKMEAIIGPDHNLGTSPTDKNAKSRVAFFKIFSGKSYIAGHLLNEKLGGPGNDGRNLTAIPGTANSLDAEHIEQYVRDPVNDQGHWYKYIVEVGYETDQESYQNTGAKMKKYSGVFIKPKDKKKKPLVHPSGVVLTPQSGKKTKVKIWYAQKLKATWYQLNTGGGRFGPGYQKEITMASPLEGGESSVSDGDGVVSAQPDIFTRGTLAKTDISAEELVLTTSTILKSVVENREGLIKILYDLRNDKEALNKKLEELEELIADAEEETLELNTTITDLKDIVYQSGYDWGFEHGYAARKDKVLKYDYYNDDESNDSYSDGYQEGYNDGYFEAGQYLLGGEHGYRDGYEGTSETDFSAYYDKYDSQAYRDGYDEGVSEGAYNWHYEQGEKHGKDAGLEDNDKYYLRNEDGYRQGYDAGYATGQNESIYKPNRRHLFQGITMAADEGAIRFNALSSFWGATTIELTGKKFMNLFTTWYQVKILSSEDWQLKNSTGNTAWMKKDWFKKAN